MKKNLWMLILVAVLLCGCTANQPQQDGPSGETLPEVEGTYHILWLKEETEPAWNEEGTPMDPELYSMYESALMEGRYLLALQDCFILPEHINLFWVLAEPMPEELYEEVTQEEEDLVFQATKIRYKALWKFPASWVDQILKEDFGLSLDEIDLETGLAGLPLHYLEETDCFYRPPGYSVEVCPVVTEGWILTDRLVKLHYMYPDTGITYEVYLEMDGQKIYKIHSNVMVIK